MLKIVRLVRQVMRRNGDATLPLVLSEISWSSGKGKSTFNYGWEETEKGQAARIREILPMLARERNRLRLQALYWYTWLSPAVGDDESFSYSGLRKLRRGQAGVQARAARLQGDGAEAALRIAAAKRSARNSSTRSS